jgi:hypothetical protein
MSDAATWLRYNDAYLAAATAHLHRGLKRLAVRQEAASSTAISTIVAPPQARTRWLATLRRQRVHLGAAATEAKPAEMWIADNSGNVIVDDTVDGLLTEAAAAVPAASGGTPPAPVRLQQIFNLSAFELETLLLCVGIELDTRTAALCAEAQGEMRPYPTFALAMALSNSPAWDILSPDRPLRYWRLIEITQPSGHSLMTSGLHADERIVNHLKGLDYLDDRLAPYLSALPGGTPLSETQTAAAEEIAARLLAGSPFQLVQLIGPGKAAKEQIAAAAAGQVGLALYRVAAAALPQETAGLTNWIRLWRREAALRPLGLVVDAEDVERGTELSSLVSRYIAQLGSPTFLLCSEPWPRTGADTLTFEIERPTRAEQASAWVDLLGPEAGKAPARLAGQFDLELLDIAAIAAGQQRLGRTGLVELWQACLTRSRPALDLLAQRIDPRATWDDIVLPESSIQLLQEIADQVEQRGQVYDYWGFRRKMSRGLGITVLFDGESGTGKTMAAEAIARRLRLDLYRIDLSAVVSKYIGETEKNLRRLFDAAEGGGGILFFDEADAIFAKRSEVRDSHDRYANIEINYLLQRMEAYGGLAILATNMKSALDQAFMRRLRFVVKFPVPSPAERKLIWEKVFPAETPIETDDTGERVDYERLAKANLTGGGISNAALNAAFLAARAGTKVTMSLIVQAVQTELTKMARPVQPI